MPDDPHAFPTDEATLILLMAACEINPDTERTHLMDFLDMGTRIKAQTLIEEGDESLGGMAGAPVYFVEHEEGYAPYSPNHVIRTLAQEVLDLRAELERRQVSEGPDS